MNSLATMLVFQIMYWLVNHRGCGVHSPARFLARNLLTDVLEEYRPCIL